MSKIKYQIREICTDEKYILEDMLYEAIFQLDNNNILPREVIEQPELNVYIDDFGKADDYCFGAVWVRILAGKVKGYGNIDDETPEFAISLFKEYRNHGIGTALMKEMINHLLEKGYKQTSLSVAKDNYALTMYKNFGFKIVSEQEDDYLMVLALN